MAFFEHFLRVEEFLWSYLGMPILILLGLLFSIRFKFPQFLKIRHIFRSLYQEEIATPHNIKGISSLQAFFVAIGGCIGIGNIVGVCLAIQIGGPGALVWMWFAAFFGMIIKYAEVYLGMKFRVQLADGTMAGGPMFFLRHAFKGPFIPVLVTVLLGVYGVEIYMFKVVSESVAVNWSIQVELIIALLLVMILLAGTGGVMRVARLCSWMIPVFIVFYIAMCSYLLMIYSDNILPALKLILVSAFKPEAAFGGVGSSLLITMYQGIARGCYSGDLGIGYASMVHAESASNDFKRQGRLAIMGIFIDTFIVCTATALMIIVSGIWQESLPASQLVHEALGRHVPHMKFFMPLFIFLLGYSTMITFYCIGARCFTYLFKHHGIKIYLIFSSILFLLFSYIDQTIAMSFMSSCGALLLVINIIGIFKLRKHIEI